MKNSDLNDFYGFLRDFGTLQSVVFKILLALPFLGIWLKLAPPTNTFSAGILSLVEFIVLMVAFAAWSLLPAEKLLRRFFLATSICLIGLFSVVYLFTSYTVRVDETHTVIVGTRLRPDVGRLITPGYTVNEALIEGSYDPYKLWTGPSIHMVTAVFLVAWFLAVSGFTSAVVAFVLYQRRRSVA